MAKPSTTAAETAALAPIVETTPLALVQQVIGEVPQADTDPTERMAAFVLSQPPERWEELWAGLPNFKDNVGGKFAVHAIRGRTSDFEGGLGVYLIADVTNLETGVKHLLACSSQMSMIQLLALHRSGRLPANVQIVEKDKPTKAGYRPIHLRYLGATTAALGDPGAVVSEQ